MGGRSAFASLPQGPRVPQGPGGTPAHPRDPLTQGRNPVSHFPTRASVSSATAGSAISAGAVLALTTTVRVPVMLALPQTPADGWAGSPRGCRPTLGTPRDVAPCHRHPAPTWQEPPARGKLSFGAPHHPPSASTRTPGLPADPLLLPAGWAAGVPLPPTLPPAQLRQLCAANMWPGGHRWGAIRAGGRRAQSPRDG